MTVHVLSTLVHQERWCDAMAQGMRRHGVAVERVREVHKVRGDMAVCWGWRNGAQLHRDGIDVLVMERGYLGDIEARRTWTAVGWNGLNGRATFASGDGSRWAALDREMTPWTDRDGYVLLAGQVPGDQALHGLDFPAWVRRTADELKALGHDVRFRPHPAVAQPERSLADDLAGAALAVTYNSNLGVDAAMAGVPVIALDEGSMAWDVAGHDLEEIVRPDRQAWAEQLAWCQWTIDEIASGEAWEAVKPCL